MRSVRSLIPFRGVVCSSVTALAILLVGCGADPGANDEPFLDEIATLQAPISTTWSVPFAATSWRIGFDIYNSALAGQSSGCFGTTMDKI